MRARDLMTPNPRTVSPDEPVIHAAAVMRDLNVGAVPVVDDPWGMRLRGVITDRDIAVRCVAPGHGGFCCVADHMTGGRIDAVSPDADVDEVMALMRDHQVRRVMVTEGGRLVGIIAQADLARREGPIEPLKVEALLERISAPPLPALA